MRTSDEANSLLASPIYIGQAQGRKREKKIYIYIHMYVYIYMRGVKIDLGASLLFVSFRLAHPHASRMYFPLLAK